MTRYSRAHYRRVSPPAETPAEQLARLRHVRACELGSADRLAQFPTVTPDTFAAADEYQNARIAFHATMLADTGRPNWGRSLAQVERVVGAYCVGTDPQRAAVVARVLETGECVWHAAAQVSGSKCWCVTCCTARGENPVRI